MGLRIIVRIAEIYARFSPLYGVFPLILVRDNEALLGPQPLFFVGEEIKLYVIENDVFCGLTEFGYVDKTLPEYVFSKGTGPFSFAITSGSD